MNANFKRTLLAALIAAPFLIPGSPVLARAGADNSHSAITVLSEGRQRAGDGIRTSTQHHCLPCGRHVCC